MTALAGIRVLDFGRYIAGPYCGAMLADFGAEVIRIEKREGSEDRYLAPVTPQGDGALFLQMNRNKRSLTLDPLSNEGREVVRRLVQTADVVIVNMPPSAVAAMGLDHETLTQLKPDIISVHLSAFGDAGPWQERLGFDSVGQTMCGAVHMTGEPSQPYRAQVAWVDFGTALHAAYGVMVALYARRDTGQGQNITGGLLATAIAFNNPALIEQAMVAPNRRALGNRSASSGPTDLFRTVDGWIVCHVVGGPLFKRWARLMGEADVWLADPRFADDNARGENGAILSARMADWCSGKTREEALDALSVAKIPAGPVLTPQEALDHPQVSALGLLQPVAYPGLPRPAPVASIPVFLSGTPGTIRSPAPILGQDTDEILVELGYDAAAIATLREAGAV
jgi:crotonobetainyl-CoA:carnitine CoA-transferase CaiB-like acyl-CoA transferase